MNADPYSKSLSCSGRPGTQLQFQGNLPDHLQFLKKISNFVQNLSPRESSVESPHSFLKKRIRSMFADKLLSDGSGGFPHPFVWGGIEQEWFLRESRAMKCQILSNHRY